MLACGKQVMKKKLDLNYVEKIKDFKIWSDLHSPKILKPALSYALDWLSPELLGTGFKLQQVTDDKIKAKIPFSKANCDFYHQIHAGLVVNAGLELLTSFISKHWAKNLWEIQSYDIQLSKRVKWNKDLELSFACSSEDTDRLILDLQKNDHVTFEGTVFISVKNSNQSDTIKLKLNIVKLKLLT